MKESHLPYINSFKQYEPSESDMNVLFRSLTHYSTFINGKANEIFILAAGDESIDNRLLQKEITDLGRMYVKSFMLRNKQKL